MVYALSQDSVDSLFQQQLEEWAVAKANYAALDKVKEKNFVVGNAHYKVQFNPARIVSSSAKVDEKSIKSRKCFLCEENRPEEQKGIEWNGYTLIVNPFPIFRRHLTIPLNTHAGQRIAHRMGDMMELAQRLDKYIIFYNGPRCGASAPDHMHFQAGLKGLMPFPDDLENAQMEEALRTDEGTISLLKGIGRLAFIIRTESHDGGSRLFDMLYESLPVSGKDEEPMLNVLCWWADGWTIAVFPRKKHRPDCYTAEGDANCLISPASVDMGGVFITPLEKDFDKVDGALLQKILDEVCVSDDDIRKLVNHLKTK